MCLLQHWHLRLNNYFYSFTLLMMHRGGVIYTVDSSSSFAVIIYYYSLRIEYETFKGIAEVLNVISILMFSHNDDANLTITVLYGENAGYFSI